MWADFDMTGRIIRVTDLTDRKAATAFLVTLATTRSWKEKRQWKEKTFFHTLTIYDGFDDLANGLEIGDLVRFKGEIDSWSTKIDGTDDYRQGVTLVARSRRIIARKRKGEDEAPDGSPAVDQAAPVDFADEDIPY
ncbi:MAG: single-stranded DNA-binding protein [Rhodospirillaceae bacterium]|nr:single-stranded DNA-binding protein [Rhodospirillales bacterium]